MPANIVFSTSIDYTSSADVVQEPSAHNVQSALDSTRAHGQLLFVTNVGSTKALRCGFYISPVGIDISSTGTEELTRILSWATASSSNGVYTVQGDDEITAYEAGTPVTYADTTRRHTYSQGTTSVNKLPLLDSNGTNSDELWPIVLAGAEQVKLYKLVKVPLLESAGIYRFTYNFVYEEEV